MKGSEDGRTHNMGFCNIGAEAIPFSIGSLLGCGSGRSFSIIFCTLFVHSFFTWAAVPGGRFSNPPTSQSPIVVCQAMTTLKLKITIENLREEFQKYLDKNYQNSRIESPQSIFGKVHIRFELGGDEPFEIIRNGIKIEWWKDRRKMTKADKINYEKYTINRVLQATNRATTVFNETFENLETELWIIIYEYENGLFNQQKDFLNTQFSEKVNEIFYNNLEQIETQMLTEQENGDFICDKTEARIIIGRLKVKDVKAKTIFNGIANNEMGLEPALSQDIYFLDPTTNKGFYMYDDRGCYVWADKAEKIKHIYKARNNWIVEYHRKEIDEYFKHIKDKQNKSPNS